MQDVTEHAGPILRLKTTKKVARNLFYLSSFVRYNEFYVLILCYAITLKEDAQSYQLAFQGKAVNFLSWIRLNFEWFLMLKNLFHSEYINIFNRYSVHNRFYVYIKFFHCFHWCAISSLSGCHMFCYILYLQ